MATPYISSKQPSTMEPAQPAPLLANLHLITRPRTLFIFALQPLLSWTLLMYICLTHYSLPSIVPSLLAPGYLIFAFVLFCYESVVLKQRLEKEGYVRRITRGRLVGHVASTAAVGCFLLVLRNVVAGKELNDFWLGMVIVGGGLGLWGFLGLVLVGPVIWYTVQ